MKIEITNALIVGTMLGVEDHGILTCYLYLEWESGGVGFGGYCMDTYSEAEGKRIGTRFGTEYLLRLFDVVGVEKWEQLKGKYVRVEVGGPGSRASRIGHITKNKWFTPADFADSLKAA